MNNYPVQYISLAEKMKVTGTNKVPDFIIANYNFFNSKSISHLTSLDIFQELEKVANGELDASKYEYVENPFKATNDTYKKYPAKLRNYDIIKPIVERFLGERLERPDTQQVYAKGEDIVNEFKTARSVFFEGVLQQAFMNELNAMGMPTNVDSKELPDFKELEDEFILSYTKQRAKYGSEALEILKSQLLLKEKYQLAFYYWLVYGRVFSLTSINYDDIQYELFSPRDVTIVNWDSNSRYSEDAQAAIITKQWSTSGIIDNWGKELVNRYGESIIAKLESHQSGNKGFGINAAVHGGQFAYTPDGTRYTLESSSMLEVEHIYWKSIAKRGILSYIDENGFPTTEIVDDSYKLNKAAGDIDIEWIPENEVWYMSVIRGGIGNNNSTFGTNANINEQTGGGTDLSGAIFLEYGPFPVQRNMINNSSVCKLPVNGTYFGQSPYVIDSIVKKGIPYQELYNIFHYRFELTLAKNKDKLMLFPIGLIPNKKGWSTDRWMHQVHAFSMAFFDETSEKALAALQAIKSIDMSLSQYMGQMWEFMQAIRREWWDSVGMNDQRYGDISSSAGKSTTQQAVYRSSVSTKEMNYQFDRFIDQDANGLIDYSRYAWSEGKKGSFTASSGSQVFYDINGEDHLSTEYGVFSSSSIEEYDNVQFLKNTMLQPLSQNGTPGSVIAKVLKTSNLAKIEELLEKGERIQSEMEQKMQEQQNESAKYVADMTAQTAQANNETKIKIAEIGAESRIEAALITADSFNASVGDSDGDGIAESDEIAARSHQRQIAREQLDEQKRSNMAKEQLDNKKVNTQLAIAKENKNKYDK